MVTDFFRCVPPFHTSVRLVWLVGVVIVLETQRRAVAREVDIGLGGRGTDADPVVGVHKDAARLDGVRSAGDGLTRHQLGAVDADLKPSIRVVERRGAEIEVHGEAPVGHRQAVEHDRRADLTPGDRSVPQGDVDVVGPVGGTAAIRQLTLVNEGGVGLGRGVRSKKDAEEKSDDDDADTAAVHDTSLREGGNRRPRRSASTRGAFPMRILQRTIKAP